MNNIYIKRADTYYPSSKKIKEDIDMEENKNLNAVKNEEQELDLDTLEKVTGGSLRDAHVRNTSSASSSSKDRI